MLQNASISHHVLNLLVSKCMISISVQKGDLFANSILYLMYVLCPLTDKTKSTCDTERCIMKTEY